MSNKEDFIAILAPKVLILSNLGCRSKVSRVEQRLRRSVSEANNINPKDTSNNALATHE